MPARDKKINKKKKLVKKEVEIPVYTISKGKQEARAETREEEKWQSVEIEPTLDLKIVKDENDLPIFQNVGPDLAQKELREQLKQLRQKTEVQEESKNKKIEKEFIAKGAIHDLSLERRKILMWTSVALLSGLIFFIWLVALKYNFFSRSFGPENPSAQEVEVNLDEAKEHWDDLQNQWSNFTNLLKQEEANSSNEWVVRKLKEKILVEEMKDKISNAQFLISNEKTE